MNKNTSQEFREYMKKTYNKNIFNKKIKLKGSAFNGFKDNCVNCIVLAFDLKRRSVILASDNSVFIFEAYLTKTKIRINGINTTFKQTNGTYLSFNENPELKELLEDRKNFSFNEGDEMLVYNKRHKVKNGKVEPLDIVQYCQTNELTKVSLNNGQTYLMSNEELELFKSTHQVPSTCPNLTPVKDEVRDFTDFELVDGKGELFN